MNATTVLAVLTVAVAVIGAVFAALRFNREDASAIVAQQSTVLTDMRALNDELAASVSRIRTERDDLLERVGELGIEVAKATVQISALEATVRRLRADLQAMVNP